MGTQQKGFTLAEMAVSVSVLGVLAAFSIPGYNAYIARQQAAESVVLMDSLKSKTLQHIVKLGKCTESGLTETVAGKYGNLVVSGTASKTAILDSQVLLKTGCTYTYTLSVNSNRLISDKTIIADLFNNGSLSKSPQSKVDDRYIPKPLTTLTEGNKSLINGDTPVTTPINPVPQLDPSIDTTLIIDKDYRGTNFSDDGYYVKAAVNAYDFATSKLGRSPGSSDNLIIVVDTNVAVVGYNSVPVGQPIIQSSTRDSSHKASAALIFDNRWNNVSSVTLANKGAIVGAGGAGGWWGTDAWTYLEAENGYSALMNTSTKTILVDNSGVIAGGGGGGSSSHGTVIGGGGAPYSQLYQEVFRPGFASAPTASKLITGGNGTAWYDFANVFGGKGGDWGESGGVVSANKCCYGPGQAWYRPFGLAGMVKEGSFVITNISSGWYKGRDISSK